MKKQLISLFLALCGILALSGCSEPDPNDGKCDICGEKSVYSDGTEEFCEPHLKFAVEYYMGK